MLRRDHVHDHPALEHLGQALLHCEGADERIHTNLLQNGLPISFYHAGKGPSARPDAGVGQATFSGFAEREGIPLPKGLDILGFLYTISTTIH
jgi:hypothetical protein